jgi:hypothetical protein
MAIAVTKRSISSRDSVGCDNVAGVVVSEVESFEAAMTVVKQDNKLKERLNAQVIKRVRFMFECPSIKQF